MFECSSGRVDGQRPPCITAEKRCNNITDCLGGEDELDYNCPCAPEGAVRLVDSILPHQGRVEFCKNGRWATVCSNYWWYRWDSNNAAVVCRQLGYPSVGMYGLYCFKSNIVSMCFHYLCHTMKVLRDSVVPGLEQDPAHNLLSWITSTAMG